MRIPFTNIEIGKQTPAIVNVDKKQPTRTKIGEAVTQRQLIRAKQDIATWRSALNIAESHFQPNRTELYRTYQDVVLDTHLTSLMETRRNNILSIPFKMVDENGKEDENETVKLKEQWFIDLMAHSIDSRYYGHSLMQLGNIIDDGFPELMLVPREHVSPETKTIKLDRNILSSGVPYNVPPQSDWFIEVGDHFDLGLLNKAAPLAIYKKNVFGAWAIRADLFGMPTRLGKTDIRDKTQRENMENMMKNMDVATWGVFDLEDELEFVEASGADGHQIYNEMVERVNSELSKLILGQTMTSDDGASRSQAEVHERVMDTYTQSDMRLIWTVVNEKLLPIMKKHGMISDNVSFVWDKTEKLSVSEQFEIDKELLKFYAIPPEYITEKYGTPVEAVAVPPAASTAVQARMEIQNMVKDLYAGHKDDKGCC